jgi:hypothetical protein
MAFRNGKSSCLCQPSGGGGGGGGGTSGSLRFDITPSGVVDGSNLVFTTPEAFVQSSPFVIRVYRNGQRQALIDDYTVSESGGPGTGYNTITFVSAAKVKPGTVIRVDYMVDIVVGMRLDITPAGMVDGVNLVFTTPEKFVQVVPLTIRVYRNGQRQALVEDYTVSESGGIGTGYDTITFTSGAKVKPGTAIRVDYIAA